MYAKNYHYNNEFIYIWFQIQIDNGGSVQFSSVQFISVTQSCPTLCDPMNCSMPGLPVHHQLPEFTQTHVHRVGDDIQPSHPLLSPPPPAPNPSQNQGPFQWVNSLHEYTHTQKSEIASHRVEKLILQDQWNDVINYIVQKVRLWPSQWSFLISWEIFFSISFILLLWSDCLERHYLSRLVTRKEEQWHPFKAIIAIFCVIWLKSSGYRDDFLQNKFWDIKSPL